jgi:hypothetical protein
MIEEGNSYKFLSSLLSSVPALILFVSMATLKFLTFLYLLNWWPCDTKNEEADAGITKPVH